jgi:putative membrane protein
MKRETIQLESILPDAFVTIASLECMTAMQLGDLAIAQANTEAVRAYAGQMIADHAKTIGDIATVASRKGLPVPTELDEEHHRIVQQMREKSGIDFDSAYAANVVGGHHKAVILFRRGQRIKNPDISALASRALTMLEARNEMTNLLFESIAPQDWSALANKGTIQAAPGGRGPG